MYINNKGLAADILDHLGHAESFETKSGTVTFTYKKVFDEKGIKVLELKEDVFTEE